MEFDIWWLLVCPLFFGLGWLAARIDIKHLLTESSALPRSYFRGLNFLLNEQPDKAIEAFIEVVKADSETVELHFALGSLFRRRGEIERAIRMHQSLLERPGLPEEYRAQALLALGQDYLKAGLLDRAEESFLKLREGTHRTEALQNLLAIYQQEKEWAQAINMAVLLEKNSGQSLQKEIANFFCELAVNARGSDARNYLEKALAASRKCVRASLMLGDQAAEEARDEAAVEHWARVEQQNPDFLALVAEKMLKSYKAMNRTEEGWAKLRHYLRNYPSLDLLDVVFQATLEAEGPEAAYQLVRDELKRNPTLLGLNKLIEAQLLSAPAESRTDLEMVKNLVHTQTRGLARYNCASCGFKARQFYWQCPACLSWESFPPRRSEEFNLKP